MATTEEATLAQGIRVAIYGSEQRPDGAWYGPKGTATVAEDGRGYIVAWDDGVEDHEATRWHFDDTPLGEQYNLVRINEEEKTMDAETEAGIETEEGVAFYDERHGEDVVIPDLANVPRYLLVEVLGDPANDEQEVRLTINGLDGDDVHGLITNLFFSINGQ